MTHLLSLGLVLYALWVLLSGHFDPLLLGFGVASTALCLWIARRMDVTDREGIPVHLGLRAPLYWVWLAVQIGKSNVDVARRILARDLPISPTTLRLRSVQRTTLGRVIYANSITLTPGTVSMSVDGDTILVHSLTEANAQALRDGEMDRRVAAFEGDG